MSDRAPMMMKTHANLLLGANPGFFVTFRKIPKASIHTAKPIPIIL